MRKLIATPANNERGPRYFEKALAAVHQGCHHGEFIQFEYASSDGQVGLFVETTDPLASRVIEPLIANYPLSAVKDTQEWGRDPDSKIWMAAIRLTPDLFPLLRHAQFEDALYNGPQKLDQELR